MQWNRVAQLPQKVRLMFFEKKFFTLQASSKPLRSKKFLKKFILALESWKLFGFSFFGFLAHCAMCLFFEKKSHGQAQVCLTYVVRFLWSVQRFLWFFLPIATQVLCSSEKKPKFFLGWKRSTNFNPFSKVCLLRKWHIVLKMIIAVIISSSRNDNLLPYLSAKI